VPTADELINAETVRGLAAIFDETEAKGTPAWSSVHAAAEELGPLSLSQRARSVAAAIVDDGRSYSRLSATTRSALENPALTGWMIWPLTEAIAAMATAHGDTADFDDGLNLLAALTPRLTSEFAIRTFLNADLDRALTAITDWVTHDDAAVRRLASEGTRPKLPWAKQVPRLTRDPSRTRPILDALYRDESEFVRRSVANHLNDVSRLSAEIAHATATAWSSTPDVHTAALIRHGMRTLVKAGDDVAVLAIDYLIHHRKANGTTAAKTFKLTTRSLAPRERMTISKSHSFKPITTRRYYPGAHAVELQVNGRRLGYAEFQLDA
jgi:3-methyladenine DNA glycosylase AlkC